MLKAGGRFYHCDMLRPANRLVEEAFRSAPAALACRRYFVDAIRLFYSVSQLLRAQGFADVAARPVLFGTVAYPRAVKPFPTEAP